MTVDTIGKFAQMHKDLALPMPKRTFRETIPMTHSLQATFPTVHNIFVPFYDEESKNYVVTHEQAIDVTATLRKMYESAININYKGFGGAGSIFKDQLVRFSQTDEGKAYGLQATRNFRLGGAIHFETDAQAERFLSDWTAARNKLDEELQLEGAQ
jgi:hypothetical protein